MNKQTLFFLIIAFLALFFRFSRFSTYPLGFDQVQILQNAEKIKNGDFTLIGPRTGPANMFTGPLIYYLCSLFMFIVPSPWEAAVTAVFISFVTGLVLYLLLKRYIKDQNQQLTFFCLWALSPYIVYIDRIFWNPNFSFLSSILVFFPVFQIVKSKNIKKIDFILTSLGMFLAYQAHFSGFLFIPLVVLFYLFFFPKTKKSFIFLLISFFSITLSFLPTFIFDLRNNFLNFRGLLEFSKSGVDPDKTVLLSRLFNNFYVTIEHFGKFFFFDNLQPLIIVLGIIIICFYIIYLAKKEKVNNQKNAFLFLWIFLVPLIYIFYRGSIPEYYYVIQFPAIIYVISHFLSQIKVSKPILLAVSLYFLSFNIFVYKDKGGLTIGNQVKLNQDLQGLARILPIKEIVYDMKLPNDVGTRFLNNNIDLTEEGRIIHVIYPYHEGNFKTHSYSDLALWIDPRNNSNLKYLSTNYYVIASPQNTNLYQDYYHLGCQTENVFKLFLNSQDTGFLVIYLRQNEGKIWSNLKSIYEDIDKLNANQSWFIAKYNNQKVYLHQDNGHILLFIPNNEEIDSVPILENLSFIFSQ